MEIKLVRNSWFPDTTTGAMFINGKWECCTLEDTDRELYFDTPIATIKRNKVYGKTAIPYGRYKIESIYWTKHNRMVPHLIGVPGFEGILIHSGVTSNDTLGCILVGAKIFHEALQNTTSAREVLDRKIFDAINRNEDVWIDIVKLAA